MTPTRVRILIGVVVVVALAAGIWWWTTRNRESTDDAQVDAGVTPIASRVGGTVMSVPIVDNQQVSEGMVLIEIDKRDFEIALERARAELADAEASAAAARAGVPITSTTAASNVSTAPVVLIGRAGGRGASPRQRSRREGAGVPAPHAISRDDRSAPGGARDKPRGEGFARAGGAHARRRRRGAAAHPKLGR